MCQYSTAPSGPQIGALTDYHITTLGHYALKGAGLVFIEATGVQPRGRISPNCPGLWSDSQIEGVRRVAEFVKSQGSVAGIQLAHAGRKAGCVPPWVSGPIRRAKGLKGGSWRASKEEGGFEDDVYGPMGGEGESWDGLVPGKDAGSGYCVPKQLTVGDIEELVGDWGRAARRAVLAGIEVIEIHAAHGYLLHQFLSPVTNRRTDKYGGSWENRARLLKEVVHAVRKEMPEGMPLFVRISATEWLEGTDVEKNVGGGKSWSVDDSIRLAGLLPDWGVDLLDVSSGGNHPGQRVDMFQSKDYQINIAKKIRAEMKSQGKKLLIGAVGLITEADQARSIVENGPAAANGDAEDNVSLADEAKAAVAMTQTSATKDDNEPMADVVLIARQFMRGPSPSPSLPSTTAHTH